MNNWSPAEGTDTEDDVVGSEATALMSHTTVHAALFAGPTASLTLALCAGVLLVFLHVNGAAAHTGVPPQSTAVPNSAVPEAGRFLLGIHAQLLRVPPIHLCVNGAGEGRGGVGGGGAQRKG